MEMRSAIQRERKEKKQGNRHSNGTNTMGDFVTIRVTVDVTGALTERLEGAMPVCRLAGWWWGVKVAKERCCYVVRFANVHAPESRIDLLLPPSSDTMRSNLLERGRIKPWSIIYVFRVNP